MPLSDPYGVLKGRAIDIRPGSGSKPHYQVHIVDEDNDYRIAVNVRSSDQSDLMFYVDEHFHHHILDLLPGLPLGFTPRQKTPAEGLDFIRGNLFDPSKMVVLPLNVPGPDNDLNEKIDRHFQRAMSDEEAMVYAFGGRWGPENKKDAYFGFKPGNGIHEIHMNQGNSAGHVGDDGVWQDGGLLINFPGQDQWVALFLKFQNQAWHTDDHSGHTWPGGEPVEGSHPGIIDPLEQPTTDKPDGRVRIVAALVNDTASPEVETLTIVNTGATPIDLGGWQLADKNKNKMALSGSLGRGAFSTIKVQLPMQLSNQGGIISILNEQGLKVDGVSYTKQQASMPGWTIVF